MLNMLSQPLSVVQDKARIERSASDRQRPIPSQTPIQRQPAPAVDLFGDDSHALPARPSTTDNSSDRPSIKSAIPTIPRQTKQGDSLLGLDFFEITTLSEPPRPSSASSNPIGLGNTSRPDLKQSILSLYSSAPKPQVQSAPHDRQSSFGGTSPGQSQDALGGLTDTFSGLGFPNANANVTSAPPQPKPYFSGIAAMSSSKPVKSTPSEPQMSYPQPLGGGGFFDSFPSKKPEQPKSTVLPSQKHFNGLDFASNQSSHATSKPTTSASPDLFVDEEFAGFSSPAPPPVPPPTKVSTPLPSSNFNSAFNLSSPSTAPAKTPAAPKPPLVSQSSAAMFDPWSLASDNNGWGNPDPTPAPSKPKPPSVEIGKPPAHITPNDISSGWGGPTSSSQKSGQTPSITADEDYGGWTSASTSQTPTAAPPKPSGGFGGTSDPFDNPWG